MKIIKNYKYKTHAIITFMSICILILSIFICRQYIYLFVANRYFGGSIAGIKLYDIEKSEYFFKKANKISKKVWTNYQLSRINFIKGDIDTAKYYADQELKYFPNNCRAHYIRGLTFGYMNELDSAIADFEEFNSCYPTSWAGHNDLAWFWFRKGNMQKVIEVCERVIEIHEYNPWLQNTYGVALMNTGKNDKALLAFKKAQSTVKNMTEADWGNAYPGNDPAIYSIGLEKMKQMINANIELLEK